MATSGGIIPPPGTLPSRDAFEITLTVVERTPRLFVRILWVLGIAIAGTATWLGLPYYLTPLDERPFSALDGMYSPTGLVGHGFGIVGSLLVIIGVTLYTARKRVRFLARFGKLSDWLHFHIFLCLVGPFLIVLHTTFRIGGLVAISFWSMAAVVSSGVFGRYVYSWIPKTISGGFLGAEDIRGRMHALLGQVETGTGLSAEEVYRLLRSKKGAAAAAQQARRASDSAKLTGPARSVDALFNPPPAEDRRRTDDGSEGKERPGDGPDRRKRARQPGLFRAIGEAMAFRFTRGRKLKRYGRDLAALGVEEPARSKIVGYLDEEARIEQQLRILHPFQRAFRYWHAFHLPLAFVMFLILGVHVAVAVAFGYTWIF
jgi:hypothetical protein